MFNAKSTSALGRIDKTTYLDYLQCPKNAWLKLHKPELYELFELSEFEKSLAVAGQMVESCAGKLFPQGVAIKSFGGKATAVTQELIRQKTPVLFQPTFTFGQFLARSDVLVFDLSGDAWNLYEIKAANSLDENTQEIDYIEDASFQAVIMRQLGINLGKIFIVHLNKEYARGDELEIDKLFITEDVTEKVSARNPGTADRMRKAAKDLLASGESGLECACVFLGRSAQCTTFKHSHPYVSDYSVHDLARIGNSKKKLASLVNRGFFSLDDIPENFELTEIQRNQVMVYQTQTPLINIPAIKKELENLSYPLYFLDFETYAAAIPMFKGFRPYQQIPFQFSLHVAGGLDGETDDYEYLHDSDSDPSLMIIEEMRNSIGPVGNVVVWNKCFERTIIAQLAVIHPEHKEFLEDVNSRIYDLMDIFKKQYYVHPGFCGRTSIKKILPVLVPDLSYNELEIQEGATASLKWFDMVFGSLMPWEKEKISEDLMAYCGLDTYAMYAIWKFLASQCLNVPVPKLPLC